MLRHFAEAPMNKGRTFKFQLQLRLGTLDRKLLMRALGRAAKQMTESLQLELHPIHQAGMACFFTITAPFYSRQY